MYSVKRRYVRFRQTSDEAIQALNVPLYMKAEQGSFRMIGDREGYSYYSGVLNSIWQSWNCFWRIYWIAQAMGGRDIRGNKMPSILTCPNKKSEAETIYYFLYVLGKRKGPDGIINGSYQEPTWGDKKVIGNLSLTLLGAAHPVTSALGVYGNAIQHLQLVRNASIHIDKDNIEKLNSTVIPFYKVSSYKYPTDIIFSEELTSGKTAIKFWLENLYAFMDFAVT